MERETLPISLTVVENGPDLEGGMRETAPITSVATTVLKTRAYSIQMIEL